MKKKRTLLFSLFAITGILSGLTACSSSSADTPPDSQQDKQETAGDVASYHIGIIQLSEHPALDSAREGFIQALADAGYEEGKNITIDEQNAQNEQANLKTISQRFVQDKADLVLAVATPAAQSIATETTEIPILGTAITDYVEVGLAVSNDAPGGNVSGTSDRTPVKEQLDLMKELIPNVKTIGILYNSSEANSEIQANMAKEAAEALGLSYEVGTITNINDIPQTVQSLLNKVDAMYIPTDNTFASGIATVVSLTNEAKIPVIVGENNVCKGGGLATVGIDYNKLGYQTGEMAVRILEGEDISKMPIEFMETKDVCINLDTAKAIGLTIPDSVMERAAIIIENGEEKIK